MALSTPTQGLEPAPTKCTGVAGGQPGTRNPRHHLVNLLIALSLGTLCFIRRWYDLERLESRALDYLRSAPIDRTLLSATICSAVILAGIFWAAWTWVERYPTPLRRKVAQIIFLGLMLTSLESVRRYWNTESDRFDWASNLSMAAIEGLCAAGIVLLLMDRLRILYAARRVALLLTLLLPALLLDFASGAITSRLGPGFDGRPSLPMLPVKSNAPRLIWLVFDEFDQRFSFDARPADLQLPELDRLREEAVAASRAQETSSVTAVAIPSLISGRVFAKARMVDEGTLKLSPEGGGPELDWQSQPNVFKSARWLGVNAAVVGWHHPYCRVLGDELVRCLAVPSSHSTTALVKENEAARDGVLKTIPRLFARQFLNLVDLVNYREQQLSERANDAEIQEEQQGQYFAVRDRALADAGDASLGLLFVHVPTPHMFPIYNRRKNNFDLHGARDYFDNLALVDRTVGEVRQALEKSGLWDRTAILITADHGFRPYAWRGRLGWTPEFDRLTAGGTSLTVPLILRLPGRPGRQQSATFNPPISNVVSGDLALSVLGGQVSTTEQASAWLQRHAQDRRSAATQALESASR